MGIVLPQECWSADHAGEIDGILGAAELGRVAKFRFFKIVDRGLIWMAMAGR